MSTPDICLKKQDVRVKEPHKAAYKFVVQVKRDVAEDGKSLDSCDATRILACNVDYSMEIVVLEKEFGYVADFWNSNLSTAIDKPPTNTFNNTFNSDKEERIFTADAS